jgi:uncharacterized membrane protein YcaP (DUF421 family)
MLAKVAAALFVADLVIIMLGSVAPAVAHNNSINAVQFIALKLILKELAN